MALTISQFLENAGAVNHARDFRRIHDKMLMGWDVRAAGGLATTGLLNGGVARSGDLAVSQRGAGANMSVDIAVGFAMVGGTESATQGEYGAFNDAVTNVVISASDPTNPRIDVIGIRNRDAEYSGANNDAALIVVTGTPAGAPAVPALPANFLTLAHVAVAAAAATVVNGNITDKRVRIVANGGTIPVAGFANLPATNLWTGMKAYDISNLREYVYNGTSWVCVSWVFAVNTAAGTMTGGAYATTATTGGDGPAVTIQTGTKALIWISTPYFYQNAGSVGYMGVAVSSATTIAASDLTAMEQGSTAFGLPGAAMIPFGAGTSGGALTAGSNIFTLQVKTNASTMNFGGRYISGIGIP